MQIRETWRTEEKNRDARNAKNVDKRRKQHKKMSLGNKKGQPLMHTKMEALLLKLQARK
jgi:hypothetical protein